MVSKANDDFPDPERPVKTINLSRGSSSVRFLRLCSRAPLMCIESVDNAPPGRLSHNSVIRIDTEHLFVGSSNRFSGKQVLPNTTDEPFGVRP